MSRRRPNALATLALACALGARPPAAAAQDTGVVGRMRPMAPAPAAAAARRALGGLPSLWGIDPAGIAWMFVAGDTIWLTRDPTAPGYAPDSSGLWRGPLPAGMARSNTSVAWAGARWAMVRLPLPLDSLNTARLLVHEAMHTLQPRQLPQPSYNETAVGSDLLDGPDGRTWLQLELRALSVALDTSVAPRRNALHDALLFHTRRLALATPGERTRENGLDLTEGIPEYSAWRLTGGSEADFAREIRARMPAVTSWVRSFPYLTGPAWALAADLADTVGAWRRHLDVTTDLAHAAAAAWGMTMPAAGSIARGADAAAARYDGATLRTAEAARWRAHEAERDTLERNFVRGPVLRIQPPKLYLSFNPNRTAPLGAHGSVLRGVEWRAADGARLDAPDGALVPPEWTWLQIPLGDVTPAEGPLAAPVTWHGPGWTLELPAGWRAHHAGTVWILTPR